MKLCQLLREEVQNPTMQAGLTTVWNGNEWQAVRPTDDQLGWYWRKIGGKIGEYGNELPFKFDHDIYNQRRFNPKKSQAIRKEPTVARTLAVPSGVVDADTAWEYIRMQNYKPVEAVEYYLKSDPRYSALYAMNVLGRRFYAAEPTIATDPVYASKYAKKFNLF